MTKQIDLALLLLLLSSLF